MNWKTAMNLSLMDAQAAQEHRLTVNTLKSLIRHESGNEALENFFCKCLSLYEKAGYDL